MGSPKIIETLIFLAMTKRPDDVHVVLKDVHVRGINGRRDEE